MKNAINLNSTKNQRINDSLVNREVIACASYMISEVSQRSEELSQEVLELFYSHPDYETAMENELYNISLDDLLDYAVFYDLIDEDRREEINSLDQHDDKEELDEIREDLLHKIDEINPEEFCNDHDIDPEYLEPYEFWIVSDWLKNKLDEQGQITAEFLGFCIWGRCTTGQSISLDHVISEIAYDMEILEGQKNEWTR